MAVVVLRGEPARLGITTHQSTDSLIAQVGHNPGNLAFAYASALMLDFPLTASFIAPLLPGEQIGVFPLANCLGEHYDPAPITEFMEQSPEDWRTLILGLGAQGLLDRLTLDPGDVALSPAHIEWLQVLRDRSGGRPNISIRGDLTRDLMDRYGFAEQTVVTGCPSLMLSSNRELGQTVARKFDALGPDLPVLNGALGNPWDPGAAAFEQALIRLVVKSGGQIHVQMMADHIAAARDEALTEDLATAMHGQLLPDLPLDQFQRERRQHFRVWFDVPAWMEHLASADFVLGARIHGTALALQAGTPALCVAWDSRTYELCRSMHIPFVSLYDEPWSSGLFDWDDIRRAFEVQFDPAAFDNNRREKAQVFAELFQTHGLDFAPHLGHLAQGIVGAA